MAVTLREMKKERTRRAIVGHALALFTELGYDTVTMAAIAAAAEVGERTVYRYFADKEEILFAEEDQIRHALSTAVAAQPAEAGALDVLRATTESVAALLQDQRPALARRAAIIASSPALAARDAAKKAGHQRLIGDELARRGHPPQHARLVGALALVCFTEGLARWLDGPAGAPLNGAVADVLGEVRALARRQ
jgi:AcrR family transcriptional regulator